MIEWFNITDLKQIDNEEINFNVPLPSDIIKNDNHLRELLELARQELIDFLPNPDLCTMRKEREKMLAAMYEKWMNKTTPTFPKGDEITDFIQDFYSLSRNAETCLEGLCMLIYYIKSEKQGVYTAIYNFAHNYGAFSADLQELKRRKERASEAGKARNKKYESKKQKVFEYAQNLLNQSKTKYTANALADKITNAYLLGNIPEISFDAENPKPTIYNWLKNEFPYFKTMKKK